jgi:hypothetical protein
VFSDTIRNFNEAKERVKDGRVIEKMNKSDEQYSSESSDSEKSHPVGEEGGIDALIGDFED